MFTGVTTAQTLAAQDVKGTNSGSFKTLYINGSSVTKKSKTFKDGNGANVTIAYWG
jgi:hypothetical protein